MDRVPHRVLVILDEAYFEYAENIEDYPDSMLYRYDNVITLRTFSKVYGLAGFRVGYGFAHHELINNLMKVKLPFEPSSISQKAAIAALDDIAHLDETIKLNNQEMDIMIYNLNEMNIDFIISAGNFITIVFDCRDNVINLVQYLLENGIIVRDLHGFGLPHCIRVTIGTKQENKLFINKTREYFNS